MVADMVAFVASQFTTSTWDVGAQELCSVVLISYGRLPKVFESLSKVSSPKTLSTLKRLFFKLT